MSKPVKKTSKPKPGVKGAQNEPQTAAEPSSFYFLSLDVENARCFGPMQTLNLSDGRGMPRPWTVLLGSNGSGKTTLLRCLAGLLPDIRGYRQDLTNGSDISANLSYGAWEQRLVGMLRWREPTAQLTEPHGHDLRLRGGIWVGGRLHPEAAGEEECFETVAMRGYGAQTYRSRSKAGQPFDKTFPSAESMTGVNRLATLQGIPPFAYGAARRMGEASLSQKTAADASASLFDEDLPLLNAEEWLLQADYAARRGSLDPERAELRRDRVKAVLKDVLQVEDIQFHTGNRNLGGVGVDLKTPFGWVSVRDLSLGYRTLMAWMVDFASRMFDRYPDSLNPLAEPAVVLVDEIDLHLHPQWQRSLIGFLSDRFPNTQFIVTAHSPLVVQAATHANVVLLRREGDHVVIDNSVETIRNWTYDQILTSDLYGLKTARPPDVEPLLARRTEILSKGALTDSDLKELESIEDKIGWLPAGDTITDAKAMEVVNIAAEILKKKAK
jgi:energy-coupling factor transporter ATP-binding protein EcfA2